jgi:hypothetical protein
MPKLILLFFLIVVSCFARGQNIFSALHLNDDPGYKGARPKKILETRTSYTLSDRQVNKSIKTFDEAGMLLTEERFNEKGILEARLGYTNDTAKKLKLTRTFERQTPLGFLKETAYYAYDQSNYLTGTTDRDGNNNLLRQTNLLINEKGDPIELSLFDGKGNLIGKESATYLYDQNRVVTSVITPDGRTLYTDTIKISFRKAYLFPRDRETYNANGDLTHWTSKNFTGGETVFEEEYLYDSFGNCTEMKIYKVTISRGGKPKRKLDSVYQRWYSY